MDELKVNKLLKIAAVCIALLIIMGYVNKIFFPPTPKPTSFVCQES